jgi:hypothetical protein
MAYRARFFDQQPCLPWQPAGLSDLRGRHHPLERHPTSGLQRAGAVTGPLQAVVGLLGLLN